VGDDQPGGGDPAVDEIEKAAAEGLARKARLEKDLGAARQQLGAAHDRASDARYLAERERESARQNDARAAPQSEVDASATEIADDSFEMTE
jgi:hypothetical protein